MMPTGFDVNRAILYDEPMPHPYKVNHYLPLSEALQTQRLQPQEHVLVTTLNQHVIVMPTLDMIYYHVAQGHWNGVDWMVSFCVLCNSPYAVCDFTPP